MIMNKKDPIDVLARTAYGEARNQGKEGIQAVCNVVMSRVAHPKWWGTDVIGVCLKPAQFSCWLYNDPNLKIIEDVTLDDPIFVTCHDVATQAVQGKLADITNGATSYYAKSIKTPKWALGKTPCAKIGDHIFYKNI